MTPCVNMPGWTSTKSQVSYIVESHLLPLSIPLRRLDVFTPVLQGGHIEEKVELGYF